MAHSTPGERPVISRNGTVRVAIVSMADLDRLKELDRQQATRAAAEIRASSAKNGASQLTDEDVTVEISEVRKSRRRSRR